MHLSQTLTHGLQRYLRGNRRRTEPQVTFTTSLEGKEFVESRSDIREKIPSFQFQPLEPPYLA